MSWINDLSSILGVPAGAATIAAAMYSRCVAAERAARPEALLEIAQVLKDASWTQSARPSAIVERIFKWTFGERHFSLKCITRSACATGIFVTAIIVTLHLILGINPFKGAVGNKQWYYDLLTMGFIPDYIALGKTRILLRQKRSALLLIILDIGLSVLIASVCFIVMDSILVLWQYGQRPYEALSTAEDAWRVNMSQMVDPKRIFTYPPNFLLFNSAHFDMDNLYFAWNGSL